jgi:Dolichyl-phosphate-mannose-protein mannosyltransferase
MLFNATGRAATWSLGTTLATLAGDLARAIASLFETTAPHEAAQAAHRWVLFALMCAGAFIRFWDLGGVGLHGDEDTMALAVMHIMQDGRPILPSGMLYPRGLTELYLMAASAKLFGASEWAFRLPSVLCGVLLIWLAWLVGRRFLRPQWNLAFAASIAFLPDILDYSQTARMYIFLLAFVAACMACIFEWERTGRPGWLVLAVATLIVGIELHALAVTDALMFLFPGLLRGDLRKLGAGIVAAGVVGIAYISIDTWVNAQYPVPPPEYAADLGAPAWDRSRATPGFDLTFDIALWVIGLAVAFFAVHLSRVIPRRVAAVSVALLLLVGLWSQLMLHYHTAAILYLAAVVVARRYGGPRVWRRLSIFGLGSAMILLIHVSLLVATPGSIVKLIGALVGQPSVWPYVRMMEYSWAAGAIAVASLAWGLVRLATGRPVADHWLLALLGVWVPVFTIGLFLWNVPSRYTVGSLLPLLLVAFAATQAAVDRIVPRLKWPGSIALRSGIAAAVIAVLVVDPPDAIATVDSGYATHPDHKGAAEFVRTLNTGPDDIVIAEDVLEQTYYLGSVNYWLISRNHARRFVERVDGQIRDFYTGTPVLGSGVELDDLLQRNPGRRVFVIGSGEGQTENRCSMRNLGIAQMLASPRFEVIYTGRDDFTKVWRAVPGAFDPPPAIQKPCKSAAAQLPE